MIASFHLVKYRRFSLPAKRLAGRVEGLRFWRPLNVGGDFAWFREHPSRWALYPRLRPDLHHWAFYAVWEDESFLNEFLAGSTARRVRGDPDGEACTSGSGRSGHGARGREPGCCKEREPALREPARSRTWPGSI
jgi:hypothetical protein